MIAKLPVTFTLTGLRSSPMDAQRFCRRVLASLIKGSKEGAVVVRLGRTGTGVEPNYRLEDGGGKPLRAFDGNTHQPWLEGVQFDAMETWSAAVMTIQDVQQAIRHFGGRPVS